MILTGSQIYTADSGTTWGKTDDETGTDMWFEEWGETVVHQDVHRQRVSLEAIRNVEIVYGGRFFISKSGVATYQSRYHRSG
jgi:hypothetical protein